MSFSRSNTFKNILALAIGIVLSLLLLEIFLRIYKPFFATTQGNKIVLPANQKYTFRNNVVDGLDPYIVHSRNSLGFRGEEPPGDLSSRTSIIAVGGSTTHCFYLSDGQDWPNILGENLKKKFPDVWINNAGLDGHSTFGHQMLLNDYLLALKPKFILFLIGINDIERDDLDKFDLQSVTGQVSRTTWRMWLVENSALVNIIYLIRNKIKAYKDDIGHARINIDTADTLTLSPGDMNNILASQDKYLPQYRQRIHGLINTCKQNNIQAVFITQPMLFGDVIDPVSGKYLGNLKFKNRSGLLQWKVLERYNNVTKQTCLENNIPLIDLAHELPKSSAYLYDEVHFTKLGALKIAEIIEHHLTPILASSQRKNN